MLVKAMAGINLAKERPAAAIYTTVSMKDQLSKPPNCGPAKPVTVCFNEMRNQFTRGVSAAR